MDTEEVSEDAEEGSEVTEEDAEIAEEVSEVTEEDAEIAEEVSEVTEKVDISQRFRKRFCQRYV